MPRSLHDELLASADPLLGRRLLDEMECGGVRRVVRGRRSRRRVVAHMITPGSQSFEAWLAEGGWSQQRNK